MKRLIAVWVWGFLLPLVAFSSGRILGLIKSSEGTSLKDNEIVWHFEAPLKELGYELEYHDMDKGYPKLKGKKDLKAVLTWYRSSAMNSPELYARWLADRIGEGIKVLVFGNYGASQDRESKKWVGAEALNVFFKKMGYEFMPDHWNSDPKKNELFYINPMLRFNADHPMYRKISFYHHYKNISEANNVDLIVIRRKDLEDSNSTMAAITPQGAFAFSPFFLWSPPPHKKAEFAFDKKRFLAKSLVYQKKNVGNKILCLYKSKDGQTLKSNEIVWHLSETLENLKYEVVFHDINQGIPTEKVTRTCVALISWFRSAKLKDAKKYISFLTRMSAKGKKLIILGNMGAHQEAADDSWLEASLINQVYSSVGIEWSGHWTNKVDKLKFVEKKNDYFNKEFVNKSFEVKDYIQYKLSHPASKGLLKITRTDIEKGESFPVVLCPNGGFAEAAYLFVNNKGKWVQHLDISKFVTRILTL